MSTVKRGDTHELVFTIRNARKKPVDLTGSTVRILAQPWNGGATFELDSSLGEKTGTVVHQLTGDLAVGTYRLEIEVTDGEGVITTMPSNGYEMLIVLDDLG